jgi:hypothetical protein
MDETQTGADGSSSTRYSAAPPTLHGHITVPHTLCCALSSLNVYSIIFASRKIMTKYILKSFNIHNTKLVLLNTFLNLIY